MLKNYAPRSSTSFSARPFSQMSGALPVVGEAVELATGGAGSRTGERFFFIDIQAVQGISPLLLGDDIRGVY